MSKPVRHRVGIQEVAAAAGVSNGLVSLALNGRSGVAEATRQRIVETAGRLGYVAHPAARTLRLGRSSMFGMVVRNFGNPFFIDLIAGAQRQASGTEATILAIDSDYSAEMEREHIHRLAGQDVAGLAIAPVGSGRESIALWQKLRPGTPTVVVNATVPGLDNIVRVGTDNVAAVDVVMAHLAGQGHRTVGFVTAPRGLMADDDRLEAFEAASTARGLRPIIVATPLNLEAIEEAVDRALAMAKPPTAIITNSDYGAHAVYRAVRGRGQVVGRDVAVVGHDDLPTSELLEPALTTVRVDRQAIGMAIFDRLAGVADGDFRAPVELVVRASG